jgi:hypothetical protein
MHAMVLRVDVDASDASRMFANLERLADDFSQTLQHEGQAAAASITGIPVRTGRLAASPKVGPVTEHSARIVSDTPYAKFIFRGTKHIEARPPQVGYSADRLAQAVADELDGVTW